MSVSVKDSPEGYVCKCTRSYYGDRCETGNYRHFLSTLCDIPRLHDGASSSQLARALVEPTSRVLAIV